MYKRTNLFVLRASALLTLFAHPLLGGVVLDGSFGTRGPIPSINNNFAIQAAFGKQCGGNLFQSFSQFNLNSSQSATFCGPNTVHNILARVTSGSPSSIDGTIRSDIHGANLFFMNPAGVLFGQHTHLALSGSFAVTTANYLKLVGGGRFNANLGGGDVLTSAPVGAFGFLNSTPAGVSIVGSNTVDPNTGNIIPGPGLTVAPGKVFSIVAGDIAINGGYISSADMSGAGPRVNLVSVNSPGEVQLDATDINSAVDVSQFTAMGDINLTNLAQIDMTGSIGGPVIIRGRNLNLDNGNIVSSTLGSTQGTAIDVDVTESITMGGADGSIVTRTFGKGNAGDVIVNADSLLIDAGGVTGGGIFARTQGGSTGKGGNIAVHVDNIKITNAGRIAATSAGSGDAGNINITADSFLIGGGVRAAIAANGDMGRGGSVTLQAQNVVITEGGRIAAITQGIGHAGDVTVKTDSLLIDGMGVSDVNTGIVADVEAGGSGDGGNVIVQAHDAKIIDDGLISSRTFAEGDGGNVIVSADSLVVTGGRITAESVRAGDLTITNGGEISSSTVFVGNAGDVTVAANTLRITAGGRISSSTAGPGNGGSVAVTADSVFIDGMGASPNIGTGIFATAEGGSSGDAGSISLQARSLTLTDAGGISSASFTSAAAGSVQVISAGPVKLKHGASISTSSELGDAGLIRIVSGGEIKLKNQSSITVSAGRNGGDIDITTPDLVYLLNSSVTGTAGIQGGNITIDSIALQLKHSTINASAGIQGGHIDLFTSFLVGPVKTVTSDGSLLLAFNSSITATGGTSSGTVNVTEPQLDLGAQLITLPTSLLSAESQLQERCTALLQGDFSSFISIGRGGTEPAPEELQSTF